MKKSILLILSAILFQSANAQDRPTIPACLIINAGVNFASLQNYDYFFLSKANPGFSGGVMIRTDENLYFMTGLHYVIANPTLSDKYGYETQQVTMQFLQLPLLIGAQLLRSDDNKRTFRAQIGPSFSGIVDIEDNDLGITKTAINKTLFTIQVGVGVDISQFVVDINYNLLMSHLYNEAGYNNEAHLKAWEFTIGYKINITSKNDSGE